MINHLNFQFETVRFNLYKICEWSGKVRGRSESVLVRAIRTLVISCRSFTNLARNQFTTIMSCDTVLS